MSSVNPQLKGSFINAIQDLILAIPSHQVAAAIHPEKHTKTLAGKRKPRRAVERQANEKLSRPPRH